MAYRLAELLDKADTDDSAQDAAVDLILRLWESRSKWPSGWPPAQIANQFSWLSATVERGRPTDTGFEQRLMMKVSRALAKEYRFWLQFASSVDSDLTDDERVLLDSESEASRDVFEALIDQWTERGTVGESDGDMAETLESLLQDRRTILEEFLSEDDE